MVLLRTLTAFFLLTTIVSCSRTTKIDRVETTQYRFSKTEFTAIDSSIYNMVDPYRKSLAATMNEVLAVSEQPMVKGRPEGVLGNFVADLCLYQTNKEAKLADVCFVNNGGLRSSLPKGDLSRGKIYELMPFENELVVMELSAADFKELCNYIAYKGGSPIANFNFSIKDRKPQNILVAGKSIDEGKSYKVVTSDYLANKGDLRFFANPLSTQTTGLKVRDAIIVHLQEMKAQGKTVKVELDNRITDEDE